MKNIIYIALFAILISLTACPDNRPEDDVYVNLPACEWADNQPITFSNVALNFPSGSYFSSIGYGITKFDTFDQIFLYATEGTSQSKIAITTTVNGCTGTTSKSKVYTPTNRDDVFSTSLKKQYREAYLSTSSHSATLEITSGPFHNFSNGDVGLLIWSRTSSLSGYLPNNGGTFPNLSMPATFKSTRASAPKLIFVEDKFLKMEEMI